MRAYTFSLRHRSGEGEADRKTDTKRDRQTKTEISKMSGSKLNTFLKGEHSVKCCGVNHQDLNVKLCNKTNMIIKKKMVLDFRRKGDNIRELSAGGGVERVDRYKYPSSCLELMLAFIDNIVVSSKKCQNRLFFLLRWPQSMDLTYCRSCFESVLTFSCSSSLLSTSFSLGGGGGR